MHGPLQDQNDTFTNRKHQFNQLVCYRTYSSSTSSIRSPHNHHFDSPTTNLWCVCMCVCVCPSHQHLGFLLPEGGQGEIINECSDFSACGAHEGKTGTLTNLYKQRPRKCSFTLSLSELNLGQRICSLATDQPSTHTNHIIQSQSHITFPITALNNDFKTEIYIYNSRWKRFHFVDEHTREQNDIASFSEELLSNND